MNKVEKIKYLNLPILSTLNANCLNTPIKRIELTNWIKKSRPNCMLPRKKHTSNIRIEIANRRMERYTMLLIIKERMASQVALVVKDPPANEGDLRDPGSIPGSGSSLGGGNGKPLQDSCLENPVDREVWWMYSMELQRVRPD